ncbi:MAG: ABC transporter permease [Planctomycetes bacterium]|nr:ABC transporter permease [Planctomycetota bacterium]
MTAIARKLGKALDYPPKKILGLVDYAGGLAWLVGMSALWSARVLVNPKSFRETLVRASGQAAKHGFAALPLSALIISLISVSVAIPSAEQLRQFGANIFIADILAVGLCQQLVPIMIGIVAAGYSGTQFAAEIGNMKVTEEITAMKAMGMNAVKILVLPRLWGLVLCLPFLTLVGDFLGLSVGALVARLQLDLTFNDYFKRVLEVLRARNDVAQGLYKSISFAIAIALVSCYRGFKVRGGSGAVGDAARLADVDSIILVIGINTVFTIVNTF